MSEEYTLIRDIVCGHNERMLNIKKYYPFFKLSEISFSTYKEGKYDILDMGYIMMAVLRFFIEENNFQEKFVSYNEYAEFLHEILVRDFELILEKEEEKELISYIFDKLKNEGKPFSYEYFDPESKKKKIVRTKLIENKIVEDNVLYYISSDAITFYLDTKEIKDESSLTIAQVLLSKMISTRNFKGATEVIVRINNEVSRLISIKNEILNVLAYDVFAGIKMYEDFMENTAKWFEDEQKLFKKNKELVDKALSKCKSDVGFYSAMEDIYQLEKELNCAMNKHSELLEACMVLQSKTDELIINAKLNSVRSTFDFRKMLCELILNDDISNLELFVNPLLKLGVKKTFSLNLLDNLLAYKIEDKETAEKINEHRYQEDYKYPDEIEEERIVENYGKLLKVLFDKIILGEIFTLTELNNEFEKKCGNSVTNNADYYSFLVHLCQKNDYDMAKTLEKPDTFLEDVICKCFKENSNVFAIYKCIAFEIEFTDKTIRINDNEIAEIRFIVK